MLAELVYCGNPSNAVCDVSREKLQSTRHTLASTSQFVTRAACNCIARSGEILERYEVRTGGEYLVKRELAIASAVSAVHSPEVASHNRAISIRNRDIRVAAWPKIFRNASVIAAH
jgi:hypothetical protein